MMRTLGRIADWLKERKLEALLRTHGMTRSQARRIAVESLR